MYLTYPNLCILVFFVLVLTYSRYQESLEGFWQMRGGPQCLGIASGHSSGHTSQAAASEVGIVTGQELPQAVQEGWPLSSAAACAAPRTYCSFRLCLVVRAGICLETWLPSGLCPLLGSGPWRSRESPSSHLAFSICYQLCSDGFYLLACLFVSKRT